MTVRQLGTLLFLAAMSATAFAQKSDKLPGSDVRFLQNAAVGGMAEVEMGRLAQEKALRDEVKQFGARMVEDHGKANEEVKKVAAAHAVTLPAATDDKHRKLIDKLSKQVGPDFDREYMKEMLKDHKQDVKEFRKRSKGKPANDVQVLAVATLPTLESHLQAAQATYDIAAASKRTDKRETGSTKK